MEKVPLGARAASRKANSEFARGVPCAELTCPGWCEGILEPSAKRIGRMIDSISPRNVVIVHIQNCNLTLARRVATLGHECQFIP
jgi:hypothetical protein